VISFYSDEYIDLIRMVVIYHSKSTHAVDLILQDAEFADKVMMMPPPIMGYGRLDAGPDGQDR
jgi:hypothetical protein